MGFKFLIIYFLTIVTHHTSSDGLHEPPSGTPSFIRSSVESLPSILSDGKSKYTMQDKFGDVFLPLRSAVESAPSTYTSYRKPLRDAVEYRPAPDRNEEIAEETNQYEVVYKGNSEKDKSGKYDAFLIPETSNMYIPQPFRTGSPYQQLVDIKTVNAELTSPLRSLVNEDNSRDLNDYKVVCYITNWSFYRKADGKFVPENLDSSLCTHILYSFASLDPETLTIKPFDQWVDISNDLYKRMTSLSDDVPVLLAIGGWTDSTGDKYTRLVANANSRRNFISTTITFLREYGFKGLHVDWNYPKCWQSDCSKGPKSDKPNFTKFIQELRVELSKEDMILGVAISGYKEVINEAYDLRQLSSAVDFLTVMTFDYHGAWESETGHVSPLYSRPDDLYPQYTTDSTLQLLIKLGADRSKIIVGLPFYGQTFTLEESVEGISVGEGTSAVGTGDPGEYTKQPGMLAYYEICTRVRKQKWLVGRDSSENSGPHANSRNQWVGYEDPKSITSKVRYVMDSGFAGVAAWTVDLDDFLNRCCSESFPLLRTINREFGRIKTSPPKYSDCTKPTSPVTPPPAVMTTAPDNGIPVTTNHAHTTTTWSEWKPESSSSSTAMTWWPTASTTTTTNRPSTTRTTTRATTTREPTTRQTTTRRTTYTTRRTTRPTQGTTIPVPAVIMPTVIEEEMTCQPGEYRPNPKSCSSFYRCVLGSLTLQHCTAGLHWNAQRFSCDWPSAAKCSSPVSDEPISDSDEPTTTTKRTTTRKTTTTTPKTTTTPRTTTTRRTTRKTTTTPRTTTTRKTTTPRTTTTRKTTTPRTTTTRRTTRKPTTQRSTTTTTVRPTRRTTVMPAKACSTGEYYSHKKCEYFYICVNGKLLEQQCGPGQQWNHDSKICDYADKVRCVSTQKYLRLVMSKASLDDPCEGNEYISYPGNCGQFLRCIWNQLKVESCPPTLHWNQYAQSCDWPSQAKCDETEKEIDLLGVEEEEEEEEEEEFDEVENDIEDDSGERPAGEFGGESGEESEVDSEVIESVEVSSTTKRSTTTTETSVIDNEQLEPLSGHFKVVCYFTNWAWYRKGAGKYVPENIDTDLCTHIVYGFAVLDYSELTVRTHDSWADIDNKFYERVVKMKEKGVKVTLAIGGWNDSQGDKYSRLVRSAASRKKFIRHITGFIEKFGFEGLDLDWEYPVCWQVDCKKGYPDEKQGFANLVKELSEEFKPRGWLLSAAVSPSKMVIDAGYDVPTLAKYFDWIAVMTYDFHGQWDKKTGHLAPLFYHPDDEISYFNSNFSIHYWMEKGAPARKLVMGMPLYGQSFTLSDVKKNGLNSQAPGPGQAGEFTKAAGFLAYYEICDRIQNRDWNIVNDDLGRMGPYAYKGNQWVSYDDKKMLKRKSQLIRELGLGGGMVWALDLDDFNNRCGQGKHPLLKTIREVLREPAHSNEVGPISESEKMMEDEIEEDIVDEDVIENEEQILDEDLENQNAASIEDNNVDEVSQEEIDSVGEEEEGETEIEEEGEVEEEEEFKVVCYFTNWAWYRQSGGKFIPEDIDPDLCSHVVYGFAVLNRDTLTIQPHDSWADIDNKFYERVVALQAKGIKVTLAIGGWNDSAGDKYSRLVLNAMSRSRFVRHVVEFIEKYKFDGLDLDWEYPVCWQVDCKKGYPEEKEGFADLVKELSHEFKPRGWLLSSAVSPSKKVIDEGYDVPALSEYFDWIAVMTYDFHGQWDKQTGHVAPMYEHPDDVDKTFNANFSINYWLDQGADRKKIIMGMPMYGQSFSLADNLKNELNSPTYGGGEAGEATRARGFLAYYEICQNIREKNWKVIRDNRGRMGPYAYLRDQWVSFDDASTIKHKSEYVKAMELGGAMIWALDLDDFRNVCDCEQYPLLKTINRVLRNYPGQQPNCLLENVADSPKEKPKPKPKPTKQPTTARPTYRPTSSHVSSPRPTAVTPTNEVQIDPTCNGRMFVPHNSDCNKYFLCQYGELQVQSCPHGLHWNRDHCDWPSNTNCKEEIDLHDEDPEPISTTKKPKTTTRPKPVTTSKKPTTTTRKPTTTTRKPITTTKKTTSKPTITTRRPRPSTTRTTRKPSVTTKKPTKKPISKPTQKPISKPPVIISDPSEPGEYKVVCYFTNWAWYRQGEGKYTPDDIDETLCTHVVYGFAVLNGETLTIKTHDSWADIDNRFYERVTELKAKGIRVTLALGGWNDSLGDKYSRLVRSASARARFVRQSMEFISKYGFEGLDLDWEYPVCWQVDCKKGFADEKEGFANLVKELSAEYKPKGWFLSAAVSPSKMVIDAGYDVPTLAKYFDWIAVMTYDFHGHWDKQTGHVAPLYYYPGDTYDYFNANFSINYWIEKGAPAKKLIMGMPLYGQSFSLADVKNRGLNEKSYGPGEAGQFTRAGGFLSYYEICEKVNRGGWEVVRDEEGRIGPYAYKGNQWVSYDDVEDIRRKTQFLKSLNLGGGMIWALDLDDFRGRCGCGKHPLLRTINQELFGLSGQKSTDCT